MPNELQGMTVAFLVAPEGVEQIELTEPWKAVQDAGGTPKLVSTKAGQAQAFNHLDNADTFPIDAVVDDGADQYDALMLPGGVANPDFLRWQPGVAPFVRSFFDAGKPCAVICHGAWTLIDAGVVSGRTLTSWPSLKSDLRNAGVNWVDEEVRVCESGPNSIISSRKPDDLPAFCTAMVEHFARRPAGSRR